MMAITIHTHKFPRTKSRWQSQPPQFYHRLEAFETIMGSITDWKLFYEM